MKMIILSALVAIGVLGAGTASANADLAKTHCGKCHEMDKKNKGPSYKSISAKFKGNEAGALKAVQDPKGDHPEIKAKPEEVSTILKWVLQQ
jgi:cytochrome c